MSRDYIQTQFPSDTMEVCQENMDIFWNFINERHNIWRKRFLLRYPKEGWTNDPILKVTKYTNVYRELDRGTIWFLENIGHSGIFAQLDLKDFLWKDVMYRLCNRIETFEEVEFPDYDTYDHDNINNKFWEQLDKISKRGLACMTSAHLTCPSPAGYSKVEGYILAINSLHKNLNILVEDIGKAKSPIDVFNSLRMIHCVGVFIAYEVLCDMFLVKAIPWTEDDWANPGPGCMVGIRLIYPSTKGKSAQYKRLIQLRDEQHKHFERLGIKFQYYEKFTKGHLSLRSCEHSLCEMSKFWLQKHNLGKQRMIFKPDENRIVEKEENGKQVKYRIIVDPETGDSLKKIYL